MVVSIWISHITILFWSYIYYVQEKYAVAFWALFAMVVLNMFQPLFFKSLKQQHKKIDYKD